MTHPDTLSSLSRIVIHTDGLGLRIYEPAGSRLWSTWRNGGKRGWLRLAVADAILSGRPLSIIDVCERSVSDYRETDVDGRHVVVEVRP